LRTTFSFASDDISWRFFCHNFPTNNIYREPVKKKEQITGTLKKPASKAAAGKRGRDGSKCSGNSWKN